MTLVRGTVADAPEDPFAGGRLRVEADAGLLVRDGAVLERGAFCALRRSHLQEEVLDLRGGLVLPGLVDTHVHFPQVRVVGGLGMPLLDWLDRCALPEEARLADVAYARGVAQDLVRGLVQAGTTTALVFGAHFVPAVDAMLAEATRVGLRVTGGLVVSDRGLREELLTTPQRAYDEGLALAQRWHGPASPGVGAAGPGGRPGGLTRYAVTPRFSLSCTPEMLDACGALLAAVPGAMATSHLNENVAEVAEVERLFPGASYAQTYDRAGLLGGRTVLAHDVHPRDAELDLLAARGTAVAHCPTSNAALGSGLFPLRRHHEAGVRVALGSDVGAGTGLSLVKEGLQAYFAQQLLGGTGLPLTGAHLLHLATAAGADALGLREHVGDLGVGRRFDAQWLRPAAGTMLDVALQHARDDEDALAKVFALATPADVARVWVDGDAVDPAAGTGP